MDERPTTESWQWVSDELKTRPRKTTLILDAGGLNNPIRDMLPRGLNVIQLTGTEFLASQQGFLDLLNEGRFKHTNNPQLTAEVQNAHKLKSGSDDQWLFAQILKYETTDVLKGVSIAAWYRGVNRPKERQIREVIA